MPPWTLSDPYHDFDGMEDELQAIVDKQGAGLTGDELTFVVFGSYLPAGNYEECCTYLPAAFNYLRTGTDRCLAQMWEHLFHIWVPQHIHELRRDGRLEPVIAELRSIFHERLDAWLNGGTSADMACNMESWCLDFLCSALVAEDHEPLLEKLHNGGVHARMLFLAIHPVNEPFFHHMSEDNADCYCREEVVAERILRLRPESRLRSFLELLQSDVLEWRMESHTRQELFEYWSGVLKHADEATAHLPGGPACPEV